MNKKERKVLDQQIMIDRNLPKGIGSVWCHIHDCRPGTCFPLHYPTAFNKRTKVFYQ